ncbi:MAG: hypothetical protein IID53_00335 [Proteobacteria bacterium]|nr:hypothetical protein [Pseudomonadota bacterium]
MKVRTIQRIPFAAVQRTPNFKIINENMSDSTRMTRFSQVGSNDIGAKPSENLGMVTSKKYLGWLKPYQCRK